MLNIGNFWVIDLNNKWNIQFQISYYITFIYYLKWVEVDGERGGGFIKIDEQGVEMSSQ